MIFKTVKLIHVRLMPFLLALVVLVAAPGCGGSDDTLDIAGSTTVQPIAEKLAQAYMKNHQEIKVVVTGGGSSTGITSVANGIVDIRTSSRELRENEAKVLEQHKIALDGITIIVHPSLGIESLNTQQIAAIFCGNITNWKGVNGPDLKIDVVTREASSGTRETFEQKVLNYQQIINTALQQPSNGGVRSVVAGLPSSIGYISIAYVDGSVKALKFDGISPSIKNVQNGTWRLIRPLLLLTRGPAKGKAKDFIDFCMSSAGQEMIISEMSAGVE